MTKTVLKAAHVSKVYSKKGQKQHQALKDISFEVTEGEFLGIMGPSGSGKTTLLNILSALDAPTTGEIQIAGDQLTGLKEEPLADFRANNIGFIFQDFNLLENLTMAQNIALPLSLQGMSSGRSKGIVEKIATRLGISQVLQNYPTEVSGGQKQRVAAARALVHNPAILLGDEPTGALDSKNARNLLEALQGLNQDFNTTILLVTHDAASASFCKRILFIQDGVIYRELHRRGSRQEFYQEILHVLASLEIDEEDEVSGL